MGRVVTPSLQVAIFPARAKWSSNRDSPAPGASPAAVVTAGVVEGALVAIPAGAIGIVAGWLAVSSPLDRLLASLSELGPGWSLAGLLLAAGGGLGVPFAGPTRI